MGGGGRNGGLDWEGSGARNLFGAYAQQKKNRRKALAVAAGTIETRTAESCGICAFLYSTEFQRPQDFFQRGATFLEADCGHETKRSRTPPLTSSSSSTHECRFVVLRGLIYSYTVLLNVLGLCGFFLPPFIIALSTWCAHFIVSCVRSRLLFTDTLAVVLPLFSRHLALSNRSQPGPALSSAVPLG